MSRRGGTPLWERTVGGDQGGDCGTTRPEWTSEMSTTDSKFSELTGEKVKGDGTSDGEVLW